MNAPDQRLLACLSASALAAVTVSGASFVANPSFEIDDFSAQVGYVGNGNPDEIAEWFGTGGRGINRVAGPFNEGMPIPDREQIAFIQGVGQLSQTISGLTAGQTYWIQFFYDARNCCGGQIGLLTKWEDEVLDSIGEVVSSGYKFRNIAFTPESDTGVLTLATTALGDATVRFDGVTIVVGDPGRVVVANPSFEASGTPPAPGYVSAGAGWSGGGTGGVGLNNAEGPFADNGLIPEQDHVVFIQGPSFIQQTLRGLVAGETYAVNFRYNARAGNSPVLRVSIDDDPRFEEAVVPVGGVAAYRTGSATFVAAGPTAVLRLEQLEPDDQTVLLDDIQVSGVVVEPVPNLKVGPPRIELGPAQQALVSVTVSGRRLESGPSSVEVRIPNEGVARLLDADGSGIVTLTFPEGDLDTTLTTPVEGVDRGATVLEIVDNGGHEGVDGQVIIHGTTSFVVNPSFEADVPPAGVGYGTVMAWAGGSGINRLGQPFLDNGLLPDRDQIAFIQNTGTMSQSISGLTVGQRYAVQMFYNVRDCCGGTMGLTLRVDGNDLADVPDIVAVGANSPFYFLNAAFTAAGPTATLEIAATAVDDATLLIDGVCIVPQEADEIVVRNPSFEASGVPANVGYQTAMAGWAFTGGHGVNIDTFGPFADNGVAGAQDRVAFIQGPASLGQVIEGLTPGAAYTLEYMVNARSGDTPGGTPYRVTFDGAEVLDAVQEPVGVGNPYDQVTIPFTAASDTMEIRFEGLAAGTVDDDQSLLLDDVRIRPVTTALNVPLTITVVAGNSVNIAWPTTAPAGLILQSSPTLGTASWGTVTTVPFVADGNFNVLEVIDGPARYYRLARP